MMNRKNFLKTVAAGSFALSLMPGRLLAGSSAAAGKGMKKLTILHTNDQHSRIEPFDASYTNNPSQGGFARRAYLIREIRRQEPNVLLLDSGDVFQGTPYFNMFGGELEFKLMSMMGYDACTMGNHDFDNGLEGFLKVLPNAKFPFICSNYSFKNTILDGQTIPYQVLKKDGLNIGIFGLGIKLEGLVGKKQYQETEYIEPVSVAQHYADFLKKEKKCDLVICLSHLGYQYDDGQVSDIQLAQNTENIDLILGGHTHTFFPEPQQYTNRAGKKVLVNQVGWAGLLLGRIEYYFDLNKNINSIAWHNHVIDDKIPV